MTALLAKWISASGFRLAVLGVALIVVALAGWQVYRWRSDSHRLAAAVAELDAERRCLAGTQCAARLVDAQAAGLAAVAEARRTAQEAARAEQAARDARVAEEAERLTAAAAEARVRADAWRRKYDQAVSRDESCRRWAEEPIPCPVD